MTHIRVENTVIRQLQTYWHFKPTEQERYLKIINCKQNELK